MDTSMLGTLFAIAPDLMEALELRALVLERVAALGPIGRRALAQRLHLPERAVRPAADARRASGCTDQTPAGMAVTERGRARGETARAVSGGRRTLAAMEHALSDRLGVARVCVVRGDADIEEGVLKEAAQAAARQLRFLLQEAHVLAVSGGRLAAMTAQELAPAAPVDVTVVPAQGGVSGPMDAQANAVAESFARGLGGRCRLLHLPEGIGAQAVEEAARVPQVREALELLSHADVLFYSVSRAMEQAARRELSAAECDALRRAGAVAGALGAYYDAEGRRVGPGAPLLGRRANRGARAAVIAVGRSRAQALLSACMHREHALLITDEGAALRMMALLRV